MFVITFIDNHRVNTVIYSAGIGLSFSHKFHQGLINSTQWTSTTWPHMNWEHQQSCKSITKLWSGAHANCRGTIKTAGCVSFLLQSPQPLTYSTVTFHCEITTHSVQGGQFTCVVCVLPTLFWFMGPPRVSNHSHWILFHCWRSSKKKAQIESKHWITFSFLTTTSLSVTRQICCTTCDCWFQRSCLKGSYVCSSLLDRNWYRTKATWLTAFI